VILVDTSAWIEFLRATGSAEHRTLRGLIETGEALATTDPVVMEVLAGARDDAHLGRLRRFVLAFEHFPVEGLADFEGAAEVYGRCRRSGVTPRSLTYCLVAQVALREEVPLLARHRDFRAIARIAGVALYRIG